jgi:WD40 repeat protein
MKKLIISVVLLLVASNNLFSQEYEIAWQKDIGGTYAQFSKDGEFIYVAGGNTINKYRSSDGSFVSTFDNNGLPKASEIYGMSISKNDKYLITWLGDTQGNHNLYDIATGKAIKQISGFYWCDFLIDENSVICLKLIGSEPKKISIIDVISGNELKSVISPYREELLKVSHNGKMFATASISGSKYYLTLWDTETLTEIKRFELEGNNMTSYLEIKFSWDDKFVGVRTYTPYVSYIFDTNTLTKKVMSSDLKSSESFGFDFTFNNKFCFYFIDSNFYIYENDFKSNNYYNLLARPLATNSSNLILCGNTLLKPKNVGVIDLIQRNITITNTKDLVLIDNISDLNEQTEFKLFDIQGKVVFQNSLFLNIDTNKIPIPKVIQNGSYIIQLVSKNINISQKILILR